MHKMTDDNIDDILNSERTFVVLFYDVKMPNTPNLISLFEKFDEMLKNKIDVYLCEIVKQPKKVSKYFKLPTLPGMVMMKNNVVYANMAGTPSALNYENAIKEGIMHITSEMEKLENSINVYRTI